MNRLATHDLTLPTTGERTHGGGPESVLRYYQETGLDYRAWSPDFNMHFGYFRRGLSPFDREAMLREMTWQVWHRLNIRAKQPARIADLGCGVGTPARQLARQRPLLQVDAITLVPRQAEHASRMVRREKLHRQIHVHRGDYRSTPFGEGTFDAGYAIESACHDWGLGKKGFVREAARILRGGARLVIADGFLKGRRAPGFLLRPIARRIARHWALETFAEIGTFERALRDHGFRIVQREDISWRIAPSVMHVPWVTARFLAGERRRKEGPMSRRRRGHVAACLLAPLLGMARSTFGYYIVTAERL